MERLETFETWCVYEDATCKPYDFVDEVDTKQHAVDFMKSRYPLGKVMCCMSVEPTLGGAEFGYGRTKAEALAALRVQLKPYGYVPYISNEY